MNESVEAFVKSIADLDGKSAQAPTLDKIVRARVGADKILCVDRLQRVARNLSWQNGKRMQFMSPKLMLMIELECGPDHFLVAAKQYVAKLDKMLTPQLVRLSELPDSDYKTSRAFFLASMACLFLMENAPFKYSNARVTMVVVKNILDLALPLPFPIDRDYAGVLQTCFRSEEPLNVRCLPLKRYLLRQAAKHYESIINLL